MNNLFKYGLKEVMGAPLGVPIGVPSPTFVNRKVDVPPPAKPAEGLKRALNYLADYGGCGFYRCMGPNLLLNLHEKAVVLESTSMVMEPNYYGQFESVKFQRQATTTQRDFLKIVKDILKQKSGRVIYEIDDVVFGEDIPLYNRNRDAFTDPKIRSTIMEIMQMMDEITVTCDYFRDYLIDKTGNKKVTTVPNYLMRWWFDRYYNLNDLCKKFEKNKKKPVVAIFASGTHVDVLNRTGYQDDFAPVIDAIAKTKDMFEWHFYGSHPIPLKHYIENGKMKFTKWTPLPNFPQSMANSGAQVTFACLQDNHFNRSKSNIKLIESGALGIPCVCPDMVTYKDAALKYSNGDEFIDCIKAATKHQTVYLDYCKKARAYTDKFWLDDESNLMKHHEIYFTEFGSKNRKYLSQIQ